MFNLRFHWFAALLLMKNMSKLWDFSGYMVLDSYSLHHFRCKYEMCLIRYQCGQDQTQEFNHSD